MAKILMNDEIDYPAMFYPTHIVDKDNKLVSVYVGASQTMIVGYMGLYVKDEDYDRIRHDKAYVFIHNPEAVDDDVNSVNWDEIESVEGKVLNNRQHIHIWN